MMTRLMQVECAVMFALACYKVKHAATVKEIDGVFVMEWYAAKSSTPITGTTTGPDDDEAIEEFARRVSAFHLLPGGE